MSPRDEREGTQDRPGSTTALSRGAFTWDGRWDQENDTGSEPSAFVRLMVESRRYERHAPAEFVDLFAEKFRRYLGMFNPDVLNAWSEAKEFDDWRYVPARNAAEASIKWAGNSGANAPNDWNCVWWRGYFGPKEKLFKLGQEPESMVSPQYVPKP